MMKCNYSMKHKLVRIINEEISSLTRDKKTEIFNYTSIVENEWNKKVKNAQIFQKIQFDLENNNSTNEKKTFFIKKFLRKNQPIKYEFNAELFTACGDWQSSVMYFRLEFTTDYFFGNKKKIDNPEFVWDIENDNNLHNCYVIIPPIEAGNKLKKCGEKFCAYDDDELKINVKITDNDKKNSWKWLSDLLEKLVDDRHEMLDN